MLRRPRFPPLQHLGGQLLGDRVPVKRVLQRPPTPVTSWLCVAGNACATLGAANTSAAASARQPSCPHRRQGHLLHILPHPLPPQVHQGGQARELLADLVHGLLFGGQPMRFDQRLDGLDLRVQPALDLLGRLGRRVAETPRMHDAATASPGGADTHCARFPSAPPRLHAPPPRPAPAGLLHCCDGTPGTLSGPPELGCKAWCACRRRPQMASE